MRVYFMGVCGVAMGHAALLAREQGHEVAGADAEAYPPMSTLLRSAGVEVSEGFDAERLARARPDHVVVGNAMSRGNPEVEWLLEQSAVSCGSLPEWLGRRVLPGRRPLVVAGTHGKTTTASVAAYLLDRHGADPGWMIGGVPRDLPGGARLGSGAAFVIEGDEYDSAFFDKRAKFVHYRPRVAAINNVEFDHADIFRDLEDVQRSFRHLLRLVPASGRVLANADDPAVLALLPAPWTRVIRVSAEGAEADLRIEAFEEGASGSTFDLVWRGRRWGRVRWGLRGLFNARNAAMGALGAAFAAGFDDPSELPLGPLDGFNGVRRRQDVLADADGRAVVEDFAHHPTAVRGVVAAARAAYPGRALAVCFEPRSNTARTRRFEAEFAEALAGADRVYLGAVHRAERMDEAERLDTFAMARELSTRGREARAFATNAELRARLLEDLRGEERPMVALVLSNGAFDGLAAAAAAAVESPPATGDA